MPLVLDLVTNSIDHYEQLVTIKILIEFVFTRFFFFVKENDKLFELGLPKHLPKVLFPN